MASLTEDPSTASTLRASNHAMPTSPDGSTIRTPPSGGFELVSSPYGMDEEHYLWYKPDSWYPVQQGAVYNDRYQALVKVGFGSCSTVWLSRDLKKHRYVVVKFYFQDAYRHAGREKFAHIIIKRTRSKHPGRKLVQRLHDTFELPWKNGLNRCLVFDPLGITLKNYKDSREGGRIGFKFLSAATYDILSALDYLHNEAHVVHADLWEGNIMMSSTDDDFFGEFVNDEWEHPGPRKLEGDRIVFAHQRLVFPENPGPPVLGDFGEAYLGHEKGTHMAMPDIYRAPEFVLGFPWDEKIDIWSMGCMIWHLFEGKPLFKHKRGEIDEHGYGEYDRLHLARMIALLGPPPKDIVDRGFVSQRYFDEEGRFAADVEIPSITLETEEEVLEGVEKEKFLRFIRRCLQWRPEERSGAAELARDPWLGIKFGIVSMVKKMETLEEEPEEEEAAEKEEAAEEGITQVVATNEEAKESEATEEAVTLEEQNTQKEQDKVAEEEQITASEDMSDLNSSPNQSDGVDFRVLRRSKSI